MLVDALFLFLAIESLSDPKLMIEQMSDSYNHIFKQSVNAFDNGLISGGSSGGEGALVGCRGSMVGIGTDIGGSIRIPANLQGLYGLSPTTGRVPMEKSGSRWYIVPAVAGPLTQDLGTLELFMDALASQGKPWEYEPFAPPLPWRRELAAKPNRPLRIGYFVDDGFCRCQPPLEQAVTKAVDALRQAGHELVPWKTDLHAEGDRLWLKAVLANGGKAYRAEAERGGEPTIPGMLTGELKDELDIDQSNAVSAQDPPNNGGNAHADTFVQTAAQRDPRLPAHPSPPLPHLGT